MGKKKAPANLRTPYSSSYFFSNVSENISNARVANLSNFLSPSAAVSTLFSIQISHFPFSTAPTNYQQLRFLCSSFQRSIAGDKLATLGAMPMINTDEIIRVSTDNYMAENQFIIFPSGFNLIFVHTITSFQFRIPALFASYTATTRSIDRIRSLKRIAIYIWKRRVNLIGAAIRNNLTSCPSLKYVECFIYSPHIGTHLSYTLYYSGITSI